MLDRLGDGRRVAAGRVGAAVDHRDTVLDDSVRRRLVEFDGAGGLADDRRLEEARLDDHDADTERARLQRDGFAHRFQRVLRGAVEPVAHGRDLAGDGADVDDRAGAALAHLRQHGADQPQRAEEVRLEHRPGAGFRRALDDAQVADTGVVHEHVDAASFDEYGIDRALHGRGIGDIELRDLELEALSGRSGLERGGASVGVAHGRVDLIAAPRELQRGREPDACAAARDQYHCHAAGPPRLLLCAEAAIVTDGSAPRTM